MKTREKKKSPPLRKDLSSGFVPEDNNKLINISAININFDIDQRLLVDQINL